MITLKTEVAVQGITAQQVIDFMLNCTDEEYQRWWPGTHLAFHTIQRQLRDLRNLVYFDEYVGKRRLKFHGTITELVPGKRIVWQMIKFIKLPAWLCLDCEDGPDGVTITHTMLIGFTKIGRLLDPLLALYINKGFEKELDQHAQFEFHRLGEILLAQETG